MLLPPSGDWSRGKYYKTAVRQYQNSSSRVLGHMDPEYFESIEFNCQFLAIRVWKKRIKARAIKESENPLMLSHAIKCRFGLF